MSRPPSDDPPIAVLRGAWECLIGSVDERLELLDEHAPVVVRVTARLPSAEGVGVYSSTRWSPVL